MKLKRLSTNSHGYMVYADEDGHYFLDIDMNCDKTKEPISLYVASPIYDPEGEPDFPITPRAEIEVINPPTDKEILEARFKLEYMLLSRNQSTAAAYFDRPFDCRYRNKTIDIKFVVKQMREIWNMIPSEIKPNWCSESIIEYYENAVKEI